MVFLLVGILVGLAVRTFARGWTSASPAVTVAALGVSSVGALLGAMVASALPVDVDFLAVDAFTLAGATAGALVMLRLLGSPESTAPARARVARSHPVRSSGVRSRIALP